MTDLQHIGGGWECVEVFGGDEAGICDAFPLPALHPGTWFKQSALRVSFSGLMNAVEQTMERADAASERGNP